MARTGNGGRCWRGEELSSRMGTMVGKRGTGAPQAGRPAGESPAAVGFLT